MPESRRALVLFAIRYLHGDETVIDHDFLCQEVGADRGLVLVGEFPVDILVHQRGLADTVEWCHNTAKS